METLNEYCHLHILQFLSRRDKLIFATVCPEWNKVMTNFFGVSELIMKEDSRDVCEYLETDTFLRIIRVLGSKLKKIDIQDSISDKRANILVHFDTYEFQVITSFSIILKSLSKHCKNLSRLKIGDFRSDYDQNQIKDWLNCSKRIKQLEIGNSYSPCHHDMKIEKLPSSMEQFVVQNISLTWENDKDSCLDPKKLPELKSLMLKGKFLCTNYNFIQKLPEIAKQLIILEIIGTSRYSPSNTRELTNLSKLRNLEKLVLKGCNNSVTDESMQKIALNCEKLQEMELDQCSELTGDSINVLLSSLPKLRRLKLRKLDAVEHIHPNGIAWNMKSLIVQSCNKLSNLENAISMMPYLKYLEVINCFTYFRPILPIMKVLTTRNQNLEITQRIDYNNAQKIVIRMKNCVSFRRAERDKKWDTRGANNVQTFKLVWLYKLSRVTNRSFSNFGMDSYHRRCRTNNREYFLEYQATRGMINGVMEKIPTHEVFFEMEKARDRNR